MQREGRTAIPPVLRSIPIVPPAPPVILKAPKAR